MPTLLAVEPAQHVFAGETYRFRFHFDDAVSLHAAADTPVVRVTLDGEAVLTVLAEAVAVTGTTVEFEVTVPENGAGQLLDVRAALRCET